MASPIIQFKRGDFANLPPLQAGEPALTLDTFEFYIGVNSTTEENKFFGSHRYWTRETASTGSGVNLVEATGIGSDYITLSSPSTLAGIVTYTFPATPEDGYFLQTDADGNLSWVNVSAGASFSDASLENTTLSGVSTFSGAIDANAGADIAGQTELDDVNVSSAATFSGTEDNVLGDPDTGAVQIDGGLGVNKNVTIGANLYVEGYSEFVGVATFKGGTINLGDGTDDNINVGGEFTSGLYPNTTDTYDLGDESREWRNASFSGIVTSQSVEVEDLTSGRVVLAGTNGILEDSPNLTFNGSTLTVEGEIVVNSGVSTISGFLDVNTSAVIQENLNVTGVTTTGTFVVSGTSGIGITGISADTSLTEDSDDYLATQKAVKAYVDSQVTATNLDFAGDSGTGSVDLDSQTFTVAGTANEIETSASSQTITIGLPDTVIVGTALSSPTIRTTNINHEGGTSAATIDSSGNITASQNLTISGNLFVNGSTTQVNTTTLTVEDSLIEVGAVDGSTPSSDLNKDLGLLLNYYTDSAKKAAVYWDDSASRIALASEVTESSSVLTANAYAALEIGSLWINDCAGQSQVIDCSNGVRTLQNITIDAGTF